METLCPSVESNSEAVHDELTLGGILRVFLPVLLHLLKLSAHKLRVLWQLAACGTPALGANLFQAQSLLEFGHNRLHGDLGITAVLHTWGQKLDFHPHLHCIVTGGALSPDGKQWRSPKQRKFLFPVQAVAALFRGKFLAGLAQMLDAGELHRCTCPIRNSR